MLLNEWSSSWKVDTAAGPRNDDPTCPVSSFGFFKALLLWLPRCPSKIFNDAHAWNEFAYKEAGNTQTYHRPHTWTLLTYVLDTQLQGAQGSIYIYILYVGYVIIHCYIITWSKCQSSNLPNHKHQRNSERPGLSEMTSAHTCTLYVRKYQKSCTRRLNKASL